MHGTISAENRVIDLGDTQLDYIEAGSGSPIVSIVDEIQPRLHKSDLLLAEHGRVTCFGRSAPAPDYGAAAAKHVTDALRKLNLDRFDLIGYGAAATVALNVARAAPGVSSITLIGPRVEPNQTFEDVKCPALTLFGTNDENASVEAGRTIELRPAHSYLMYVYDAGRAAGDDRPEVLAFIIREFMERREEFLVSRENGRAFP